MKLLINVCFVFVLFVTNISYGQSYECDNNFGDCGTPNQSGGGGGGGAVLIANTDLGDTYQNADDYDDDGVEDPTDNCLRVPNPDQLDRDSDGRGDMCDNCLNVFNPHQNNVDGDSYGDYCDDDMDNDDLLNKEDDCPYHWGNDSCFNVYKIENNKRQTQRFSIDHSRKEIESTLLLKEDSCQQSNTRSNTTLLFFASMLIYFLRLRYLVRSR